MTEAASVLSKRQGDSSCAGCVDCYRVSKRRQQNFLRKLLEREDWKLPVIWNLRMIQEAVYFAIEHGLKIPPPHSGRLIVNVFLAKWDWERRREAEERRERQAALWLTVQRYRGQDE